MTEGDEGLGRLLDEGGPAADAATFEGIVRRHRARRERRLKQVTAASVVVAVAAAGVAASGLGRSSTPVVRSAASKLNPASSSSAPAAGGATRFSANATLGKAPAGLAWAGGGAPLGASVPRASGSAPASSGSGSASSGTAIAGGDLCTVDGCGVGGLGALTHQFDRSAGGVQIRAFTEGEPSVRFLPLVPSGVASSAVAAGTSGTATPSVTTLPVSTTTTAPSGGAASTTTTAPSGGAASTTTTTTTSGSVPPSGSTTTSAPSTGSTTSTTPTTTTTPTSTTTAPVACPQGSVLVAEVSDSGAVGEVDVPLVTGASPGVDLQLVEASVIGTRESAPMVIVVAHVAAEVTNVQASFADGTTDQMAPVDGWVVLGDAVPSGYSLGASGEQVTLDATGAGGTSLETTPVPSEPAYAVPVPCVGGPVSTSPSSVGPIARVPAGTSGANG
jgi:hypothetical protein